MAEKFESKSWLSENEIKKLGVDEKDVLTFQRHKYRQATHLDTWISSEVLQKQTFRTESLALSMAECKMIMDHCSWYRKTQIDKKDAEKTPDPTVKQALSEKIQSIINDHFPNGFFCKLNSRSPKDSTNYDNQNPLYQEMYRQELSRVDVEDDNQVLLAFVRFQTKANLCKTVEDFYRLFGASFRIVEDLQRATGFGEDHLNVSLELREFHAELPDHPEAEFRCFVHKRKMTAVTQYFEPIYFPELVKEKEQIAQRIQDYYASIQEHIPMEDFVIDLVVLPNKVFIIELNPFYVHAGAGLFSWKTDRELMMNGPFELRVRESPVPEDPLKLLPLKWKRFTDEYRVSAQKSGKKTCTVS